MDDKEKEEGEETESENLRDLILQQFSNLEPSEGSDDDSYKVRLSCILEDDESESSGTAQKDFSKDVEKERNTNKESEKGPPEPPIGVLSDSMYDSEISDEFVSENLQITDLDEVTLCEKTGHVSDDSEKNDGFAIKKLKSSDNVHKRPFVVRRRELSSDSSDLDISVTNSAEGPSSDLKIVEMEEEDDENTLNLAQDNVYLESEASADEDMDQKMSQEKRLELEVVDNETLAPIFEKVSRTYLEKTMSNVKWEENEKIDNIFRELVEEEVKKRGMQPGEHLSLQDVHIRGVTSKEYNPPVPPETYLWEELKRLRERGGYPWTYLDKPPFDEATWKKYMEHVYEPINPPPQSPERKPDQPIETHLQVSIIPETDQRQKNLLTTNRESTEESKTSEEMQTEEAQEIQDRLESRFLAPSPTITSDTTASQSKTDVTSTVLDTSEFEDLPVKQGSLVKTRREQMRARATDIQQRLRNHAGRIRNKFNNMPSLGRPRRETSGEKGKFKIPSPKISFPDRSRFKFPEKAKLHLPETKFNLPDRSKFHLPERPKFSEMAEKARSRLPERPKFSEMAEKARSRLPERPRFSEMAEKARNRLPERPKFSEMAGKAKIHFPDRSKFHLPDKSRFHLSEKFHLPEKAKFNLSNRPKLELFKKSPEDSPSKKIFDFDLKSYPKLFTRHSKEYTTSSPKQTRGRTPPPKMQQELQQSKKIEDIKYMDDDLDEATDSRKSESLFEKDIGYMEDLEKVPTVSTKSSTSRLSEISDDRKKGVLEEINPDEFFLRQKGISQDDIDMGQYLSREIREAFRSPDVNALAKMDYDENIDPRGYQHPERPMRMSEKVKSILKKRASDPSISEDGYKTYPPRRPGRKSRSQSKSLLNEDAVTPQHDEDDVNVSRYDNVDYEEDNISEYYKSPGPAREYQYYKVPRSHAPVCPSPPVKRKSSLEDEESHKRILEDWEEEVMVSLAEPPKPMARKKHKKKVEEVEVQRKEEEQEDGEVEFHGGQMEELESFGEEQIPQEIIQPIEEVVPQPSPVPPKRTRTRSSGSRSLRSLAAESELNRSFHSEPGRHLLEESIISEEIQTSLVGRKHEYEVTDLDDPGFGYATVGKPSERQKKPEPPKRKKEVAVPVYNTYPRRAPIRPLRNYSTLGPSRPPRQKKIPPIEKTLAERQSKAYAEIKNRYGDSPTGKDLQTEKVIEKMKGRPLPPPPRPPRQKSKGPDDEEQTEEEKLSISILKDEEFPVERKVTVFVHEPPPGGTEEACAETQTDPLPEDFSFGTEESEMPEFSHEQLKIQQAFLEEMKKEEEELRQKGGEENDLVDAELKAEVIRQIEDIIAEEKRILERKKEESVQKDGGRHLDVDVDAGYASLERRGHREAPQKMEKLQVKDLEVDMLNVREVQSEQIFVKEVQSNRIASPEIDNRGGTIAFGDIDLPPSFIDQVVAKIPWETLRQSAPPTPPTRQRRNIHLQDDSDEEIVQRRRSHRRHYKPDEERRPEERRGIPELSLQLARACTSAGAQALREFIQTNVSIARSLDRELCVQAVLCIAIALIAGFFLFGFDAKIVHLHRWDFQFPPQPPSAGF